MILWVKKYLKSLNQATAFNMAQIQNSMYTPSFSYTYPGKLDTVLLQKPKINTPSLSDLFTIMPGIRCGQYLNLVQPLTTVLTKGTAECAPTYTQAGSITDRKIETGLFEINLEWCKKEFAATCSVLSDSDLIGDGISGYELGGRLRTVIFDEVLEAARLQLFKIIFLSDNSLGAGSTNPYSAIDGVFTHFLDSEASYCVKPVDNTLPNAHNSVLGTNEARDSIREVWGNAQLLLKQVPASQKIFWVSGSVWENYYDSIINDCCTEGSWRAGQDGLDRLFYRGIELLPLWAIDDALENDDTNPFYDEIRHFVVLTTKDNHVLGTERASDLNNLEMCYDCYRKTTLIQGEMRIGYQFKQCDLISWAK
jgi:hypothetical protein